MNRNAVRSGNSSRFDPGENDIVTETFQNIGWSERFDFLEAVGEQNGDFFHLTPL